MKSLVVLLATSLLIWAVLLYPGWLLFGDSALLHSAVAWVLCVVPGLATMAWVMSRGLAPETRALAILAGSGIRMFACLGAGLVLHESFPEVFGRSFWTWVAVFYLMVLAVEVGLLVRHYRQLSAR